MTSAECPLSELEGDVLARLASVMTVRPYLPGDVLIRQGEPGETLFVLLDRACRGVGMSRRW